MLGYLPRMTDRDDPVPPRFTPTAGDPSLELFGQGWTPETLPEHASESYEGRHRVEDD
jgi:hypothetical protein